MARVSGSLFRRSRASVSGRLSSVRALTLAPALVLGSADRGAGDQEQACSDDDKSDGSSDVLTGWGKAFYGDGRCYDSHRAQVHDTENQEDRCQASTTVAAVEAETQAVSPGCAGIRW